MKQIMTTQAPPKSPFHPQPACRSPAAPASSASSTSSTCARRWSAPKGD